MSDIVLDKVLLTSYVNDLSKDIVKQMIDLYIQQSKIYLEDIESSVVEQSHSLWQEHCHKMKGAAGSVGLKQLHAYLVKVEKSQDSSGEKSAVVIKIKQLNDLGITAFNQWLNAV